MATLDDFSPVLSEAIANLPQAVLLVDAKGRIHFVNQGAADLFGYAREEMVDTQLDLVMPEALRRLQLRLIADFCDGKLDGKIGRHSSFYGQRKDGREIPTEASLSLLTKPGLAAVAMMILNDIPGSKAGERYIAKHLGEAATGSEALVALDMIEDNVLVLDREWCYLFVNEAMLKLNQLEKSDFLGKPYWEVFPDMVGTPLDDALRQAFDRPRRVSLEYGSPETGRWYEIDIIPSASTLIVHSHDITDRKQALAQNQQLMQSLDSIPDPIAMMDSQLRYTFVNLAGAGFIGRTREELLGHNIFELSPWLRDTPFGKATQRAVEGGDPFTIEDYYRPRERWLSVHYFPGPDGFTIHITDITDLKHSQQEISKLLSEEASEAQLHAVFDLMPSPMVIADSELRYTYANPVAMSVNDRTAEQMIGVRMWDLNPAIKDSELVRGTHRAFETGERQQFETPLPPSGRWFQVEAIPWRDQVILAAVDITKLKESEKSVGILTQTLEQAMDMSWNRNSGRDNAKRPPKTDA